MAQDRRAIILDFVERAYRALDQIDYYRLLNISSSANADAIQTAYYKLAASIHPDVHGIDIDPEYRKKLTAVFSRTAEAYRVLFDVDMRARYDRELAQGHLRIRMGTEVASNGPEVKDANALRFFRLGQSAFEAGDYKSAVMNLRFALQVEPDSAAIKNSLAQAERALG